MEKDKARSTKGKIDKIIEAGYHDGGEEKYILAVRRYTFN